MRTPIMTPALRARALVLREGLATQVEVAEQLGISPKTFSSYLRRGRAAGASGEAAEFAARWDGLDAQPLSQVDLERLLEAKARKGTTIAILALLQRPWDKPVTDPGPADTPLARLMHELHQKRETPSPHDAVNN